MEIRELITGWAAAAHGGDLEALMADYSEDIVMFDVPPPHDGVRGLDAYRDTWPGFFRWQASGAVSRSSSWMSPKVRTLLRLALLRCGSPPVLAAHPERRLRLSVGLRRVQGRWQVTHEHHSLADETMSPA